MVSSSSRQILLVEDDQEFADQVRRVFTAEGIDLATAHDLGQAIEALGTAHPRLILLKGLLSNAGGACRLMELSAAAGVPLVVFASQSAPPSGHAWQETIDRHLVNLDVSARSLIQMAKGAFGDWNQPGPTASMDSLLADLPVAVWSTDRDLRILSGAGHELGALGVHTRPHVHATLADVFGETHPITMHGALAATGSSVHHEWDHGASTWQTFHDPRRDAEGRVIGTVALTVNTTERRQREVMLGRLSAIVESSDDAIVSKDLTGKVLTWNRSAERIFGYTADEMIGQSILKLIPEDRQDEEEFILTRIRRGERLEHFETVRRRRDGRLVDVTVTVSPVLDSAGNVIGVSKIARDISGLARADRERRESDARLRAILNNAPVVLFAVDASGRFTLSEGRGLDAVGLSPGEVVGASAYELYSELAFVQPDGSSIPGAEVIAKVMSGKTITGLTRVGDAYYDNQLVPQRDANGRIVGLTGVAIVVTQRQQSEAALRDSQAQLRESLRTLHTLSRRLDDVRERERAHVARDVHDHLGQALTALKLDVAELHRRLDQQDLDGVRSRLDEMSTLIDTSIEDVRRVAAELRPVMLDLGLVAAMRAYLQDWSHRSGIAISVSTDDAVEPLPDAHAIALFRIMQEALTNVIRHAGASAVTVRLAVDTETARMEIADNGRGMAAPAPGRAGGAGLAGIRDRAALFGGQVKIASGPAGGVRITVELPARLSSE